MECDGEKTHQIANRMEFQSTHSHGVRRKAGYATDSHYAISIHALTWSATECILTFHWIKLNFNPRTHMECDSENVVIHTLMISIPHIIAKTDAKKGWINA